MTLAGSSKTTEGLDKTERSALGMTHQLFYDTHSLIDAFLRLLRFLDTLGIEYSLIARRLCQDCLESLFGRMRQAGGGRRDLSVKDFVDGIDKAEEKVRRKAKRVKALEARRNSGAHAEDDEADAAPAAAPAHAAAPVAALAPAVPAAAEQAGPTWLRRILLPANAKAFHEQAMKDVAHKIHRVCWSDFAAIQPGAGREAPAGEGHKKRMRKISTAKHIKRTAYAALKVDLAIHMLNNEIADALRLRRHGGWV